MILLSQANALYIPLADESVHCVVTSPPYWGLRDYGVNGQFGLEPMPEKYIANMVRVFREVRRVLRSDGTLWLNLGDTYAGGGRGGNGDSITGRGANASQCSHYVPETLKVKDLCGIPWRVAFALQADGWWLRNDIIWHKPNPMPESVRDRCTVAHEYVFLLSKSARYFYDADAIKEPVTGNAHPRGNGVNPKAAMKRVTPGQDEANEARLHRRSRQNESFSAACCSLVSTRNKRTVWTIPTSPYSGAHFATFPPALVEPCIKAGTSKHGVCPVCGAPWTRVLERTGHVNSREPAHCPNNSSTKVDSTGWAPTIWSTDTWRPSCDHNADPIPAIVLDPFAGSGTTMQEARRLGRRSIGLDLSSTYLTDNARERLELDKLDAWENGMDSSESVLNDLPLFAEM